MTGLCLGLLALGPGLRRGFLLSYDMVFVPREPFAAAMPGLAPPRAVPSDLVVAAASRVVPGDIVQKLVLVAIFMLGCAGVAALLDTEPLLARLAGGVFYVWNPYVAERLIIGQWALLLGYAGLPWVLRAVLSPDEAPWRWTGRLCLSLLPAVIGGFAAMTITALVLVPAVLFTRSARRAAIALAVLAAGCLPWLIPSLQHTVYVDPRGSGRVRRARRHPVRQRRQPADAGRRLERADGPGGLRRSLVGVVAGRGDRGPGSATC